MSGDFRYAELTDLPDPIRNKSPAIGARPSLLGASTTVC